MSTGQSIRVLVIDDSAHSRRVIRDALESFPHTEVVGTACDGEEALHKAISLEPDLITLDLGMPRMDGFTFLRLILERRPTPVIVISGRADSEDVFRALDLGAVDFVAKPTSRAASELDSMRGELLRKIHALRELRIEKVRERVAGAARAPYPEARAADASSHRTIAIGASTGGPTALMQIFHGFAEPPPCSFLVSQHMPSGFTRGFAERIDRRTAVRAREAEAGELPEPGLALIAPGGSHLELDAVGGRVVTRLLPGAPDDKYAPSIDRMFASAAKHVGSDLVAVVLTGMGSDGRRGARAVKEAGGTVIAESEDSAVIFGMPQQVIRAGCADAVLHLDEIANAIRSGLPPRTTRCGLEGGLDE
jgi:two-component system chemotaxis response regulator CheB